MGEQLGSDGRRCLDHDPTRLPGWSRALSRRPEASHVTNGAKASNFNYVEVDVMSRAVSDLGDAKISREHPVPSSPLLHGGYELISGDKIGGGRSIISSLRP